MMLSPYDIIFIFEDHESFALNLPRLCEKNPFIESIIDNTLYDFYDLAANYNINYSFDKEIPIKNYEPTQLVSHDNFIKVVSKSIEKYNPNKMYNGEDIIFALFGQSSHQIDTELSALENCQQVTLSVFQHVLFREKLYCTKMFARTIFCRIIYFNEGLFWDNDYARAANMYGECFRFFQKICINNRTSNIHLCEMCNVNYAYKNEYCDYCLHVM